MTQTDANARVKIMHLLGSPPLLRRAAVLAAGLAPLVAIAWLAPHLSAVEGAPFTGALLGGTRVAMWLVGAWWAAVSIAAVCPA